MSHEQGPRVIARVPWAPEGREPRFTLRQTEDAGSGHCRPAFQVAIDTPGLSTWSDGVLGDWEAPTRTANLRWRRLESQDAPPEPVADPR